MKILIYHNPHCSKSRQTLQMLTERGVAPQVVEYLKTPPSHSELSQLLTLLGLEPRQLMRTKEPEYRELGLDNPDLDRTALIDAMVRHPKLIERPIIVNGSRAAIGRPPENVLKIL